jgi:hypothetical protein
MAQLTLDPSGDPQLGAALVGSIVGDQTAAGYILSTHTAVLAIGGWSGSDNAPTLAQFQEWVKDGKIGYFIASDSEGGPGGVTVYDLTS